MTVSAVAALGAVSFAAGLAEAAGLFLIVSVATGLADNGASQLQFLGNDIGEAQALGLASVVALAALGLNAAVAAMTARQTTAAVFRARVELVGDFLDAPWSIQSNEPRGGLQELASTHANRVALSVVSTCGALTSGLNFLALVATAIVVSPAAAIILLAGVGSLFALLRPLMTMTRRRSAQQAVINSEYATAVAELSVLARETRVFGVRDEVRALMVNRARTAARSQFANRFLAKFTGSVYQFAALLLVIGTIAISLQGGLGNPADLGAVVLLLIRSLSYGQQFSSAVQQEAEIAPYLDQLEAARSRYQSESSPDGHYQFAPPVDIDLVEVGYQYPSGPPILANVTLHVPAGQALGIVGPSGSGKSTLLQILTRLRTCTSGSYCVSGQPASVLDDALWTSQIRFVPQDNLLLRGTVLDNIRFHRTWLSDDELIAAARLAHVDDEICSLPKGYQTQLGAAGIDLSGGQRQRLGIARALAGSPSVIILDEPTSALDSASERLIQQTLAELKGKVTLVVVAHRMQTLDLCDRIIVLEGAKPVREAALASIRSQPALLHDTDARTNIDSYTEES